MPRDFRVYLEDILAAITKIRRYMTGFSKGAFAADDRTVDAVVRNLEVIGEAVKQLPPVLRARALFLFIFVSRTAPLFTRSRLGGLASDTADAASPSRAPLWSNGDSSSAWFEGRHGAW